MAIITGSAGPDHLIGTPEADVLDGLAGNDTLEGGAGLDTLLGGSGNDFYYVDGDGDLLLDSGGIDTVIALCPSWTLGAGFEKLILRVPFQESEGYGNELNNTIRNERTGQVTTWIDGADGNDTLIGGGANDCFEFARGSGDYGSDWVNGGAGSDVLWVGTYSAVVVNFRAGTVSGGGVGGSGHVDFRRIEIAASGSYDDLLIANNAGIVLYAGAGNDTLVGGAGDDVLYADYDGRVLNPAVTGDDRLAGGRGNDRLVADGGSDTLDGGAGVDDLRGGAGNDVLRWDSADSRLDGGDGDDTLKVASGNLNLTVVQNDRVVDIERIDLTAGGNNRLTLGEADLLDLSSTTDVLMVFGDAGDSVDIAGPYAYTGTSDGFRSYQVGLGTLLVDTDIAVVM